jgi:hypothetical protein
MINDSTARLIAAAPDMLKALKEFSDIMGKAGDWPDTNSEQIALHNAVENARAAINMATGIAEHST